ncbi:MAG TPA: hypothetical protein VFV87_03070, partial [Pirellulaceae bacterium]|nr:hypothetical protein [Pirellulaceae bacterium]
ADPFPLPATFLVTWPDTDHETAALVYELRWRMLRAKLPARDFQALGRDLIDPILDDPQLSPDEKRARLRHLLELVPAPPE